jgi:hypothetical protein
VPVYAAAGFYLESAMVSVISERMTAEIDGDFVVFVIGMRINKWWKPWIWWPTMAAMPRMLRELEAAAPESGFLGHNGATMRGIVQYWRSFEHLEAYARADDRQHWPAWVAFNRRIKSRRGDVGIWHETFLVRSGDYEALYSGMPPTGLGRVGRLVPATGGREGARGRLGRIAA